MKRREVAILVLIGIYFVGSEVFYARSIQPEGVLTAADHLERFGQPLRVTQFERDEETFFRVDGWPPPWWVMALPSSTAAYVFDEKGSLVDWWPDPGDHPSFDSRWPIIKPRKIPPAEFVERFGAHEPH